MDRYNEQQEYQNKLDVCEAKKLHLDARFLGEQKRQQTKDLLLAKQKLEEEQKIYDVIMRRQSNIAKTSQQFARCVAQKVALYIIELSFIHKLNGIYIRNKKSKRLCQKKSRSRSI